MNPKSQDDSYHPLAFFNGGVPPGDIFAGSLDTVEKLLEASEEYHEEDDVIPDGGPDVCFIALISYFESFLKDHFAAIGNVCPSALIQFAERRPTLSLGLSEILHMSRAIDRRLGSMVAEQLDFGTAKAINAIFFDLINCSPFSRADGNRFSNLLNDRNLIVHHGGIFTLRYHRQRKSDNKAVGAAFRDSLALTKKDYREHADFLASIVSKLIDCTNVALPRIITESSDDLLTEYHSVAIDYLTSGNPLKRRERRRKSQT